MIASSKCLDKLYLSKGEYKEIFVNTTNLPQHQIDGIRFLYKQFKKRKPGVIINDPSWYGKTLQIVLFLNAVRPLLDKRILILCSEKDAENWLQHFHNWTPLKDEVVIERTNPLKKVVVCINPLTNIGSFSRPPWSVVIVDAEQPTKEILRTAFMSDYKIWCTSVDLKENLNIFASIYEWLCPTGIFNFQEFVANKNDRHDVIQKSILLDAFLEDIVIRRKDFTQFRFSMTTENDVDVTQPKVTRKNKDITGTKIKRSKRKIVDNINTQSLPKLEPNTGSVKIAKTNDIWEASENSTLNNKNDIQKEADLSKDDDKESEMDIETFIREQKPIGSEDFKDIDDINRDRVASEDCLHDPDTIDEIPDTYENIGHKNNGFKSKKKNNDVKDDEQSNGHKDLLEDLAIYSEDSMKLEYDATENKNQNGNENIEKSSVVKNICTEKLETESNDSINTDGDDSKKDIDTKITELEEKTMIKFKGTFLDRLF